MIQYGFTQEKLAFAAKVSENTLIKVFKGKSAQMVTFKKLADALKTQPNEIVENYEPIQPPQKDYQQPVLQNEQLEYSKFDETTLPGLLADIAAAIRANATIYIIKCNPGSVRITLAVHNADMPAFLQFADSLYGRPLKNLLSKLFRGRSFQGWLLDESSIKKPSPDKAEHHDY